VQAAELERATRMALDQLTARVNPRNLERMRHLKARMAALEGRVDTVRGVLEKLLDDDRSMAALNLTAKHVAELQTQQLQQQQLLLRQQQLQQQQQSEQQPQQQQGELVGSSGGRGAAVG
ncbi:hypothetical protein Agub_g11559, partial [Astrephomene gubernaculifera]